MKCVAWELSLWGGVSLQYSLNMSVIKAVGEQWSRRWLHAAFEGCVSRAAHVE